MPCVEPEELYCPITSELFQDPVVTADGHTYEREAIAKWLASHDTSPLTGKRLSSKQLIPNLRVKSMVLEFGRSIISPARFWKSVETGDLKTLQSSTFTKSVWQLPHSVSKMTPLTHAAAHRPELLGWMLDTGASLDAVDGAGYTALERAAMHSNSKSIETLLQRKAGSADDRGRSVLLLALGSDSHEPEYSGAVRMLLAAGVKPPTSALHHCKSVNAAKLLIGANAGMLAVVISGDSVLHAALSKGNVALFESLLRRMGFFEYILGQMGIVSARRRRLLLQLNHSGETLLKIACLQSQACLHTVLRHIPAPTRSFFVVYNERTPLHYLCGSPLASVPHLHLLLAHFGRKHLLYDLNSSWNGDTPLHVALSNPNVDAAFVHALILLGKPLTS
jgi:ankyrin repeat protein